VTVATEPHAGAAEFVEHFDAGWRGGGPADRFLEHFLRVTDPDVLLTQPLSPPVRGHAGMRRQFNALFGAVPDLRAEVFRWGPTPDGVLIEFTFKCTLGGRPLEWDACDRILLRDGLLVERHSYFDPLPVLRVALTRPRAALRLLPLLRKEQR
jgi:ketosteroid isomerase-like protein